MIQISNKPLRKSVILLQNGLHDTLFYICCNFVIVIIIIISMIVKLRIIIIAFLHMTVFIDS